MAVRFLCSARVRAFLAATALLPALASRAHAQGGPGCQPGPCCGCPLPYPLPSGSYPSPAAPQQGTPPQAPTTGTAQDMTSPTQEGSDAFNQNFNQEASSARGGEQVAISGGGGGYLDPVVPANRFRLRFDAAWGDNAPDRAEYFYAQPMQQLISSAPGSPVYVNTPASGTITTGAAASGGGSSGLTPGKNGIVTVSVPGQLIGNSQARGLGTPDTNVNYQQLYEYFELAPWQRFSLFLEAPQRFLEPQINGNAAGFGDLNTGFRWAMLYDPARVLTFQWRTYIPTGNVPLGLGTGHVSLEPSLLYFRQLSSQLQFQSQLTAWVPVNGTDFAGNIIEYGLGLTYIAYDTGRFRVAPVLETLGWTVLNGKETAVLGPNTFEIRSAGGDTIVNGKFGVRLGFGQMRTGFLGQSDFYVGYGRALTGDVWYKDILRVEYRIAF